MESKKKICGITVLYNPDKSVISNINSYLAELEILVVVNNSEDAIPPEILKFLKENPKIKFIQNPENLGIAKALNQGAQFALEKGFYWLLTMDQDSSFKKNDLNDLIKCTALADLKTGIISPLHLLKFEEIKPFKEKERFLMKKSLSVMTSGNLLNLPIFSKIGPFLEKLFIDNVDKEYCLRLSQYGFKVLVAVNIPVNHNLGNREMKKFITWRIFNVFRKNKSIFKHQCFSNHNYIRRYYITRNRLFVGNMYKNIFPQFYKQEKKEQIYELLQILFFEKNKLKKFYYIYKGYKDYKQNKFGKLYIN